MIDTFQALAVVVLAVLPGALYTYAFERQAGRWGATGTDRLLRFLTASALLHGALAAVTYQGYRTLVPTRRLARGDALPWWVWLLVLAYVALPALLGDRVGSATRQGRQWALRFTGPSPAPRAWDHLFGREGLNGWVRLRLLDAGGRSGPGGSGDTVGGRWIVGAYSGPPRPGALGGYAAGYPQEQDLYLPDTAECDEVTGEFVPGADGLPVLRGAGVLVRWDQVAYLEFVETSRSEG